MTEEFKKFIALLMNNSINFYFDTDCDGNYIMVSGQKKDGKPVWILNEIYIPLVGKDIIFSYFFAPADKEYTSVVSVKATNNFINFLEEYNLK